MEKSYYLVYQDDLESALRERGLNKFIILNNKLAVLYTPLDFDSTILNDIYEISWYNESTPMSSLIDITNYIEAGEGVRKVTEVDYIYNNEYNDTTGKGVIIANIDSGVSYLHPDLISVTIQYQIF